MIKNKIDVKQKEVKSYGHLELSTKNFPAVKNLTVGTEIKVIVTLSVNSIRSPDVWEIAHGDSKPGEIRASGQIVAMSFPDDKKAKDETK
jgi:hypothetical protein